MTRFSVRAAGPADHDAVRACMLDVFRESGGRKATEFGRELWDWQYLRSERGSLVVIAEERGALCGYFHARLLDLRHGDRLVSGAMIQDVGTLESHRGQGVFREMGAFALASLRSQGVDLIYTFPNQRSLPSFVRNHAYSIVAKVPVYLAPLDLRDPLTARAGAVGGVLGRILVGLFRAVRVRRARLEPTEGVGVVEPRDAALEALSRGFAKRTRIHLDRTSRYTGWRFGEKPGGEYQVWGLRANGELSAYVVTRPATMFSGRCVMFMDFGCREGEEAALRRLVGVRLAAEREAGAAMGVVMGLHPEFRRWGGLGFVRLPEAMNPRPFNLLTKPLSSDVEQGLLDPANWLITLADWDVF